MTTPKAVLTALAGLLLCGAATSARADERPWDWVFVYYMSYDNDLEKCGRPILDMLGRGVASDKVVVTCQADFTDADGMRRYVFTQGKEAVEAVPGEGSAEEETLRDYLAWVKERFPGKKYALVFLDHGGRLGQMSYDQSPGREGGQEWLEVVETGQVIRDWGRELGAPVELVFLQQCGKGTLENYHAFRGTGRVVMGSQTTVGAPNYYYTKTLAWACEHPEADGVALAERIRAEEPPNMFTTYTAVRSEALDELPARLAPVLQPLLDKGDAVGLPSGLKACFRQPPDEAFVDGLALLEGLYQANQLERAPLEAFSGWVKEQLICGHRVSPARTKEAGDWCGFSIYLPLSRAALDRYAHYPIYRETELDALLGRLLTSARPAAAPRPRGGR